MSNSTNPLPPLSASAERVLALAAQEAAFLRHYYLGTEHLFNGLCKAEDDLLAAVFAKAKVDPLVRRQIRQYQGRGPGLQAGEQMLLTPRMRRIFDLGGELAGTGRVEPIHLLLGLLKAGDGLAVRLLSRFKFSPETLKQAAEEILANPQIRARARTPFLSNLGRDLTALAREGRLEPVIGRKAEIQQMAQTLLRKKKNNVLLVGDAGVGKTAVVEGLAQMLLREDVPPALQTKRILEIATGTLVSGTKYRGDLEERVQKLLTESKDLDVILFIDEFHTLMGSADSQGAPDIANMLKPALANGEIRVIGATTWKEYRSYIEPDAAFERRFQVIDIREMGPEETLEVLGRLRQVYEEHHQVRITREALEEAVTLAVRFIPERRLPDKAIDLMDQACARMRIEAPGPGEEPAAPAGPPEVGPREIAQVVASLMGVPLDKLRQQLDEDAMRLEELLKERILGQDEAIQAVAATLRLLMVGLTSRERPRAAFLFLGPTGVGKTALAQALAQALEAGTQPLVRLDMSEYMEQHAVAKLIGSPPGYVGYGDEGQLSGPVRRSPHAVVLLDEIEKAHPEVLNLLLQVLDAGHLTDGKGRRVNFKEAIIIFTSNITVSRGQPIGFMGGAREEVAKGVPAELRSRFRPEFLNRLDKIIYFSPLSLEACHQIAAREVQELAALLAGRGISLEVEAAVLEVLLAEANHQAFGAREVKRTVARLLAEPLFLWLLKQEGPLGQVLVNLEAGQIGFALPPA